MKMLNNISRSQAIYRHGRISAKDIAPCHYAFVLAICKSPGRSQDSLAKELCLNKSTVARSLNFLEQNGYVTKSAKPFDKRQFCVYPTEKMTAVLPEVKKASGEWMALLSEGIAKDELDVFNTVLMRMESRAREIIERQEENK